MKAVEVRIGKGDVLFGVIDEELDVFGRGGEELPVVPTANIPQKLANAYDEVKNVISSIATDMGERLKAIEDAMRPKQAEMEFSVGLTAEAKAVVFSGKGEGAFKVKLTWELGTHG